MARTKASVGAKVSSGKSSKARCSAAPPPSSTPSSSSGDKSRSYSGGNSVCPRETPKWQKPITNFFITNNNQDNTSDNEDGAGTSSSKKSKRNIIHSDDERDSEQIDNLTNNELDETIELEPLSGEQSHKIDDYYSSKNKGKGKGKASNKENIDSNNKRSTKRDLEEVTLGEESGHVTKKIKI